LNVGSNFLVFELRGHQPIRFHFAHGFFADFEVFLLVFADLANPDVLYVAEASVPRSLAGFRGVTPILASAFYLSNIPYRWEQGVVEPLNGGLQ
jgi:hypothetical protein